MNVFVQYCHDKVKKNICLQTIFVFSFNSSTKYLTTKLQKQPSNYLLSLLIAMFSSFEDLVACSFGL